MEAENEIVLPPLEALKRQIATKRAETKALESLARMRARADQAGISAEAFAAGVWVDVTEPKKKPGVKNGK